MNLLVVNILSSVLYLPLVMLDLVVVDSMGAQCVLSMTVSHMIASLSMLSTLAIAVDQYLAILHALRYHHLLHCLRPLHHDVGLLCLLLQDLGPNTSLGH